MIGLVSIAIIITVISVSILLGARRKQLPLQPPLNPREKGNPLKAGDHVIVYGGYDNEPAWLAGSDGYFGVIDKFVTGQNGQPAALVRLEHPINFEGIEGNLLVMQLRYTDGSWHSGEVCHVELLSEEPDDWNQRDPGKWIESHAIIRHFTVRKVNPR